MTKRWCSTPRESLRRGDVLFHDFASGHDGGRSIGRHVSPAADRRAYPPHARSDRFGVQGTGRVGTRATVTGVKDARLTLLAGFTTVRNIGARGFRDVGVRDGINAGEMRVRGCWCRGQRWELPKDIATTIRWHTNTTAPRKAWRMGRGRSGRSQVRGGCDTCEEVISKKRRRRSW